MLTPLSLRDAARPRRAGLRRAGFTAVEMLVAMTLLAAVLGIATKLFQRQTRSIGAQVRRSDSQQNAAYAISFIERELRVAGVGVIAGQPVLVAATPRAIVFNANLVTADSNDTDAVYLNPDADASTFGVFSAADVKPLPTVADNYPDTTYVANGSPSRAETIAFWFAKDASAKDTTEHILWRRVNGATPEAVARGIQIASTDTVFQFFKADSVDQLTPISASTLPLSHVAKVHREVPDTGKFALIDSVRVVKLRLKAVSRDPKEGVVVRRVEATVRILNGGMAGKLTCGADPIPPSPKAEMKLDSNNQPTGVVTWGAAVDESGGERDVERYVIFRRPAGATAFAGEPIASIPAGQTSYTWVDLTVRSGEQWVYGVAAQDCSPQNSPVAITNAIVIIL